MKKVELLKRLNQQGAVFVRHGAKHDVYRQPLTGREATVPRHDEILDGDIRAARLRAGGDEVDEVDKVDGRWSLDGG